MFMGNKDNRGYTNSLAGRSKDEIICDFAYSLATASERSPKNGTKQAFLALWRKSKLEGCNIPEKLLRKYKVRALMHGEDFVRLAGFLKTATESGEYLGAVSSKILMDFIASLSDLLEDEDAPFPSEIARDGIEDAYGKVHWARVRCDWASAVAFLRTFYSKDEYIDELERMGIPLVSPYKMLTDVVFSDTFRWFPNRENEMDDKKQVTTYSHPSEYYELCMAEAYDRLIQVQDGFVFAASAPEYGAFRGYAVSGLSDDAQGMRSGWEQILSDEMEASPMNADRPEKAAFAPPESVYLDFWLAREFNIASYEYARAGIDIAAVCREADLARRHAISVIKEAFLCCEILNGGRLSFTSKKDKEAAAGFIVRLWIARCFEKEMPLACGQKNTPQKEGAAKTKKAADDLRKENESLKRSVERADARAEKAEKRADSAAKSLMAEIADLKKQIKEKDALIKEQSEDIDELKSLFDISEGSANQNETSSSRLSEEEFRAYIREHKVLVWGLREETAQKFRALYPELTFVSSDRRLTKQQLEAYEVFIMATNYTNHGNFFAARDAVKRQKMPMAYLEKTANTPEALYRALDIAVFGGAKALH